jgi:hypothetical protein
MTEQAGSRTRSAARHSRLLRALRVAGCLAVALALLASAGSAQSSRRQRGGFRGWGGGGGGYRGEPPRYATAGDFDGSFHFCRVEYESYFSEAGGMGWWTDYPGADVNLSVRLSELTKTWVGERTPGEPNHLVVKLTDEALFKCPFAMIEDVGTLAFSEAEVDSLRKYLLKGGFLWADDFWGDRAWANWVREIGRVLPPGHYPIVDIPADHAMLRTLFQVGRVPQVPSIQFWRQSGRTSERGAESATMHARMIADESGRVMVIMTHNTDIADTWEREGEDPDYFYTFSPDGYAFAIDVLLYSMTH